MTSTSEWARGVTLLIARTASRVHWAPTADDLDKSGPSGGVTLVYSYGRTQVRGVLAHDELRLGKLRGQLLSGPGESG